MTVCWVCLYLNLWCLREPSSSFLVSPVLRTTAILYKELKCDIPHLTCCLHQAVNWQVVRSKRSVCKFCQAAEWVSSYSHVHHHNMWTSSTAAMRQQSCLISHAQNTKLKVSASLTISRFNLTPAPTMIVVMTSVQLPVLEECTWKFSMTITDDFRSWCPSSTVGSHVHPSSHVTLAIPMCCKRKGNKTHVWTKAKWLSCTLRVCCHHAYLLHNMKVGVRVQIMQLRCTCLLMTPYKLLWCSILTCA